MVSDLVFWVNESTKLCLLVKLSWKLANCFHWLLLHCMTSMPLKWLVGVALEVLVEDIYGALKKVIHGLIFDEIFIDVLYCWSCAVQ